VQALAGLSLIAPAAVAAQSGAPDRQRPGLPGRVAAEQFGAVGDGRSDDSAALQAAIDALEKNGGGVLVLGNGTYRVDKTIEIDPTRTSISGARSILDCRKLPRGRPGLLIRAKAESPVYEQGTQYVEGITILGAASNGGQIGIALRTGAPGQSSRIALRNLVIESIGLGIDFGARTYLCQSYSVQIFDCGTGVAFTSSDDAGENISFYGCSIFNTGLGVENRGGAFANFVGCSFDYCTRRFLGLGLNQFTNCWFEKHRPEREEEYPFELIAGELTFIGGGIQISGVDFDAGNRNRYMFMIRDRLARVYLRNTAAWNWRTASDELAGGAGSIFVHGLTGSGRKFLPTVLKNDEQHNVFGSAGRFGGRSVGIPCWIDGPGATRVAANELEWREGSVAMAKSSVSTAAVADQPGAQGLRIRKGVGPGIDFSFHIATPVSPGEGFTMRLRYRLAGKPSGPVWFQIYFAQAVRTDGFGVPVMGNDLFWGEAEYAPKDLDDGWRTLAFNSHNLDESSPAAACAPAWATHVHLAVNLVALASDTEFWIDDLGGWRL
jgi:hypothetical protein